MTPREIFKFGFLLRCADAGMTIEQTHELAKQLLQEKRAFDYLNPLKELATYPITTIGTALAGSGILGAAGGYTAAKMTDDDADPEEAKAQELVAAYKQYAEQARRNAARYRYRQPAVRRPRLAMTG